MACSYCIGPSEAGVVALHRCELRLGMDPLQNSGPPLTYRPHCTPGIRVGKLHLYALRNKCASIFLPSNILVLLLATGERSIRVLPVCGERGSSRGAF